MCGPWESPGALSGDGEPSDVISILPGWAKGRPMGKRGSGSFRLSPPTPLSARRGTAHVVKAVAAYRSRGTQCQAKTGKGQVVSATEPAGRDECRAWEPRAAACSHPNASIPHIRKALTVADTDP